MTMDFGTFLNEVINDGIEAVKRDYCGLEQQEKLRGAVEGFNLCRNMSPLNLSYLLEAVAEDCRRCRDEHGSNYWFWRCREAEVGWVCNVISAVLLNEGYQPIRHDFPTSRGLLAANRILSKKHVASSTTPVLRTTESEISKLL